MLFRRILDPRRLARNHSPVRNAATRTNDAPALVGEAIAGFGEELAAARGRYDEVKQLDETLFAHDYESL